MEPTNNYFLVKIQFVEEVGEKMKKVKRDFLVRAVSVTDAEARVIKHLTGTIADFEVKSCSESKIVEVVEK